MTPSTMAYVWLLGPCTVATKREFLAAAKSLAEVMGGRPWWYKCSYRKANRTAHGAPAGPGLRTYLGWVRELRRACPDVALTTDVHEVAEVAALASVFDPERDIVQVPAFLSRQTDLLRACGDRFRVVNVKKLQCMSPRSACHVPDKVRAGRKVAEVWCTERGVAFGYETLLPDFGAVPALARAFDRVLLDSGHSTQRWDADSTTRGSRALAARYFAAAPLFGYRGTFQEVHPEPERALSDRTMQLDLAELATALALQDHVRQVVVS